MSQNDHIYITTTLPYVNADPHVGFAMEIIRADVLARYYRLKGKKVFFNTGTDEHGAKIAEAAEKEGADPKSYTDRYAGKFQELRGALGLSVDNFIRTTDEHHVMAAQEFWKKCLSNLNERGEADIYKKLYRVKYCVGCELEKTDSELVEGKCPLHPNRELEIREEENYFFRWSRYQKPLLQFYEENPNFVIPDFRGNEVRAFVERGLEDFSISRLKSKMSWGVPVPNDDAHVMYVWFDALVNYISAIGWPLDMGRFNAWWPVIQYCGKDNNRQQSAMWQAMLMSAKLPCSKHIVIDGFITSGGQKMSKSLGNVINPFDVIEEYKKVTPFPEDVLRFTLMNDVPAFEDGDLTMDSIRVSYSANLQNGIGNLVSRIMKMAITHLDKPVHVQEPLPHTKIDDAISAFDGKKALEYIMGSVRELDGYIQETEPFKLVKTNPEDAQVLIVEMVERLNSIATLLCPFLPNTAEEILRLIRLHQMPEKPLFNRLP